jgi:hypothetical protein
MNDTDVFIQPLPERFGVGSHILIEKSINDSKFEPTDNFLTPAPVKELIKQRMKRSPLNHHQVNFISQQQHKNCHQMFFMLKLPFLLIKTCIDT